MKKYKSVHPSRSTTLKEQIDDLTLSYEQDIQIFSQLNWLNKISLNDYLIRNGFQHILDKIKKKGINHLKIVDLGCGDGKNIRDISALIQKQGVKCTCIGFDFNEHLIDSAISKSKDKSMHYFKEDVLSPDFELPDCDVLFSSQFIYRFTDGTLVTFLKKNISKIRLALFFTELKRSRMNQTAFKFIGKLIRLHPIILQDGVNAMGRAWKCEEMQELLKILNLPNMYSKSLFHRFSILLFC